MSTLSSQPYKGARDYYPADKRIQNFIFNNWKRIAMRYGYEEYATPLVESFDIYTAQSGQYFVNERIYDFMDREDHHIAIRPEMTPSVSRLVAARRDELPYPSRLFSIANFMHYEPQRADQEREFWQLNIDIFDADGVIAEAEIISMGVEMLRAFNVADAAYVIKINSRKLIHFMMSQYLGLNMVQAQLMMKLFDGKHKISIEEFRDLAMDILGEDMAEVGLEKISTLLNAHTMSDLPEQIRETSAVKEVEELFAMLRVMGIGNVVFDITLMRGFDYYTGVIFEFHDTMPGSTRALLGGGRYDGLVGLFDVTPISAVGIAADAARTEQFLRAHKLFPVLPSTTEVYITVTGDESFAGAMRLASTLRDEGVNVELGTTRRSLDEQMTAAAKKGIGFVVFVGSEEVKTGVYGVKDVISNVEQKLSFERIVSIVKDRRRIHSDDLDDLFE